MKHSLESVRTRERVEKCFTQGYASHIKVQSVTVKSALPALKWCFVSHLYVTVMLKN